MAQTRISQTWKMSAFFFFFFFQQSWDPTVRMQLFAVLMWRRDIFYIVQRIPDLAAWMCRLIWVFAIVVWHRDTSHIAAHFIFLVLFCLFVSVCVTVWWNSQETFNSFCDETLFLCPQLQRSWRGILLLGCSSVRPSVRPSGRHAFWCIA